MIKFSATASGDSKLASQLDALPRLVEQAVVRGLERAVIRIHEIAVKSIQAHQSQGRTYGNHVASEPGYPPNTDTGRLVNSIRFEIDPGSLSAAVGTDLSYGLDLEIGTQHTLPRPWLRPAVEQVKPTIVEEFKLEKLD